ncbi:MAG: hypothetical protein KUG77_00525 [Nannocystaceae bacterium]|nr:hypothetical protein [Nannocystaceae bacterium]
MTSLYLSSPTTSAILLTLGLGLMGCDSGSGDNEAGKNGTDGSEDSSTSTASADSTTADETGLDSSGGVDETGGGPVVGNPCAEVCGNNEGAPPAGLDFQRGAGADSFAHCSTYQFGGNDTASVAVFSMFQDGVAFLAGENPITVSDLQVVPTGDGEALEWSLLTDADFSNDPLSPDEYVGHTITADTPLEFTVELKPAASGDRTACLVLSTEGGDDYLINLTGRGSEDPLLNFSPSFRLEEDVRFGAMTNLDGEVVGASSNEKHEPGIVDSTGAVYSIGRNVGPGGFAEATAIVKRDPDGSWGYFKLLEGRDGDAEVDAKIMQVSDETADFGTSSVVALDGGDNLFIITNVGVAANSDITRANVVKLDPDGNVLWSRGWVADPAFPAQANDEADFQTMMVVEGKVILSGATGGGNDVGAGIPIVVLDADSGDLILNHIFQIDSGGTQEALSMAVEGDSLYLGGKGARGFVAGFSGLDGTSLTLDWTQRIDTAFSGARVRSMTMAEGNVCGLARGTSTQNQFHMFCLDSDGSAVWNRQLVGNPSSRTRAQVIEYLDGSLYAGGSTHVSGLSPFGEAALLKVSPQGELDWSAVYYTGKGAEEVGFHSIKGISRYDGQLLLQGQSWTGANNKSWYKGYWYDGADLGLEWTEFLPNAEYAFDYGAGDLFENPNGTLIEDTSAYLVVTDIQSEDPNSVEEGAPAYLFQTALDRANGPGGDYDALLQVLTEL